jgi:predicted metal-dependent HD superfamily phosphohydrolase
VLKFPHVLCRVFSIVTRKDNQEFFPFSRTVTADLKSEFTELLGKFSADAARNSELADLVILRYSEKHRFYHNLSHIHALLNNAEHFSDKFDDYDSVKLAIWFHDVIYKPKSLKNEAKSASLMNEKLAELSFPKDIIEKVEKLISATEKHDAANLDDDGKTFLDLDLGILGAEKSVYEKYAKAIRSEYSFVPQFLYRRSRAKILKSFLNRQTIYFTNEMREKFETAARRNIANEIKELS